MRCCGKEKRMEDSGREVSEGDREIENAGLEEKEDEEIREEERVIEKG